jgi:glycogen(starch) synthase
VKILVLSNLYPPDTVGGYEMGCRQAVDALRARGHDVRVLTSAPRTPVATPPHVHRAFKLTDMWDPYIRERTTRLAWRQAEAESHRISAVNVHALLTELESFRPDVVYAWMLVGIGGLGLMTCLTYLQVPWVWHLMDEVPPVLCANDHMVCPMFAREFNRRIHGSYLACSEQLVDRIEQRGTRLNGEVEILPNWVSGPCPPVRSKFYRGGTLRIVSAAAFIDRSYDKGMDLLIKAAVLLRARGLDRFSLDLYGKLTDHYYSELVRSARLQDHVRFRGAVTQAELIAAYGDYDVFAFPARLHEPCAFAPLEAAPSGCVPIMSRISGNAEWFVHGVHCLKVPRTAEGFADALGEVIKGRVDLEAIGRRVAAAIRTDFHLDILIVRIEEALARASRRPRDGAGTPDEAYRLALLAERLVYVLLQEPHLEPRPGEPARPPEAPSAPVKKAPHFALRARSSAPTS